MKKRLVFLIIVAILMMTIPVSAAMPTPVGERIIVGQGGADLQYFPINTPFHINHGWHVDLGAREESNAGYLAKASFALEIDDVFVGEDFINFVTAWDTDYGAHVLVKYYFFNFVNGMTGTHTFTGHWYIQCKYWQDVCENPNEIVEAAVKTITVIFQGDEP